MFLKNYFWIFIIFLSNSVLLAQDKFSNYKKYQKTNQNFELVEVADNLNYPWGMTFIDEENLLVTEKNGKLFKINVKNSIKKEIKLEIQSIKFNNVKKISSQQGGLLDVLYNMDGFILVTVTFSKKVT